MSLDLPCTSQAKRPLLESHLLIPSWLRRPEPILVCALLIFGFVVRARQYLAAPSYWYDEAYLLLNIFDKTCVELVGPLRCDQAAPPLFLCILRWLYVVAGPSELVMRLPAFLATSLALLVSVPLARKIAGKLGWLWLVGFVALSQHTLTHGVEVKPYANDLLMTELILLATLHVVLGQSSSSSRRWGLVGLLGAALLGPWLSYPSVFVLGGACMSLLVDAWARKERSAWLVLLGVSAVTLASCAIVWVLAARHQRTRSLEEFWASAFVDLSSVSGALLWISNCLVQIGNYGTTSMGIPLLLLAGWGLAILWRRSLPTFALLVGPLLVAGVANGLRRYPLEDRLLFFAVPCLWCSAAIGIDNILRHLHGRRGRVGVIALSILLLPGVIRFGKHLIIATPRVEFREAFAHVTEYGSPTDYWWVSHSEVVEVYYGKNARQFLSDLPPERIAEAAQGKPLWVIVALPPKNLMPVPELMKHLEAGGMRLRSRHDLSTVAIFRYSREEP